MFSSSGPPGPEDIRRLYDAAAPLLLRIAARIAGSSEAGEDIVHDAFARLVEKGIPFPTMDDAKFWLIRVTKNGALNYAKRKGREAKAYERWWRGEKESSGGADEVVFEGRVLRRAEAGSSPCPKVSRPCSSSRSTEA